MVRRGIMLAFAERGARCFDGAAHKWEDLIVVTATHRANIDLFTCSLDVEVDHGEMIGCVSVGFDKFSRADETFFFLIEEAERDAIVPLRILQRLNRAHNTGPPPAVIVRSR